MSNNVNKPYHRTSTTPSRYRKNPEDWDVADRNIYESYKKFYKAFLFSLSDDSFLSSIDLISFKDNYVQVKRGYWKLLFSIRTNNETKRVKSYIARHLKNLFIERFAFCSSTKIKNFLIKKIRSSFIDFRNVLQYNERIFFSNPTLTKESVLNIKRKKNYKYFEDKAKRYKQYVHNRRITHDEHLDEVANTADDKELEYLFYDNKTRESMEEFGKQILFEVESETDPIESVDENLVDIDNLDKIVEMFDDSENSFKVFFETGLPPYIIVDGKKQTDFNLHRKPSQAGSSNRTIRGGFYVGKEKVGVIGRETTYVDSATGATASVLIESNPSGPSEAYQGFQRRLEELEPGEISEDFFYS